jgi:oligopeptide transport system permease protein
LVQSFISLLVLIFISFGLLRFFPGSPLQQDESLDPEVLRVLQKHYKLDENIFSQFVNYLGKILEGDFGQSMHFVGRSVNSLIWEFGQTSFLLGFAALVLALTFAVIYTIWTRRRKIETKADMALLWGLSIPSFVLGPFLIWFFGFYLSMLPVALLEKSSSYILPVALLAFKPALSLARILSSSMDQILQEKYIQTSRAMGFSEAQILSKWALKNSWLPLLAQIGPLFASLISGSFLVEVLFSIPGLGAHFVESVLNRDWPLILGLGIFYGILLIFAQLVTDLLSAQIDPRIQAI